MSCYIVPAMTQPLAPEPLDPDQVIAGNPQVSVYDIVDSEAVAVGIWQHTAGISTDVEVNEIFVVLSGRATIEVSGGPTLEVCAGDVGVLAAGAETTWTVHEDLRKIYVISG